MNDTSTRPRTRPATQRAAQLAQEWFELLLNSYEHLGTEGFEPDFDADGAIQDVADALTREWEQREPIAEGDHLTRESIQREAGYLFGVQVGLRLRSAGGPS
jgi:hypothetical protein